jgi:hypothetical protein
MNTFAGFSAPKAAAATDTPIDTINAINTICFFMVDTPQLRQFHFSNFSYHVFTFPSDLCLPPV